ncbi:MAG TPA: hypothetical protein DEF41_11235 [Desulfovibrio sp.]|uniref:Uncharacterized protein n=1 Tax=Nitratidesulfovibrio vulgaris (strain ATCC 29579 / DSM 644 / CCUG 34227 / NCIMB 8303 / VKM B-1760 / Hildenborough) TaxID=882 RepID=Q729X6_NITV2|nr:hypothetical protein DVU_2221 [Nitratidesulfovibrio vulgaris str. Hildenborough]HBW16676.1 hypothetical protein [Desulfovibrio sp.]
MTGRYALTPRPTRCRRQAPEASIVIAGGLNAKEAKPFGFASSHLMC